MQPEQGILKTELAEKLAMLQMPLDQFAVFGSGPMFLHEIRPLDELVDFDLIAVDKAWEIAVSAAGGEVQFNRNWMAHHVDLFDSGIEVWNGWGPGAWDLKSLIRNSVETESGLRFVRLIDVLHWKQARGAPKDIAHIELIKRFLES